MRDELLSAEEVACYLGVRPVTVWRWCRDGDLLCLKIGRSWRVRRSALEGFVRRSERSKTLVGKLGQFVEVPDNLLAIVQNQRLMMHLDAAFLQAGEARDGTLVKYQREGGRLPSPENIRERLRANGVEAARLENEGRLRFVLEKGEPGERLDEVERLVTEERESGRSVWVDFNWDLRMGMDKSLEQQRTLTAFVEDSNLVLKTTILEEDLDEWPGSAQRRVQVLHSGTMWLSEEGLALSRMTPSVS